MWRLKILLHGSFFIGYFVCFISSFKIFLKNISSQNLFSYRDIFLFVLLALCMNVYIYIYIYIYIYMCIERERDRRGEREDRVFANGPPCLTLSNIWYVSIVKWSNPEKGVVPSPTPKCRSYCKRSLLVTLIYIYIYIQGGNPKGSSIQSES